MPLVSFHSGDRVFKAKAKKIIQNHILQIFISEGKTLDKLEYIFCSDDYLLQINKNFLQHDYYTDIITFPISDEGEPIIAEIYISLDRVKDNAIDHGTSLSNETLRVLFHGALHLCGYTDKTKNQQAQMRRKEDFYINLFHVKQ